MQYDHGTLTYTSTLRKDNNAKAMHASLQSFVEVRKRTELNNDQKKKLRKWAEKLAAEDIEEAQILKDAVDFFEERFDVDTVEIYVSDDSDKYDPTDRSERSIPFKPAIHVE